MGTVRECVCCREIGVIQDKNREAVVVLPNGDKTDPPCCITQHPGFLAVCTNKWVLQTAEYQYLQQYREPYKGPEHKKTGTLPIDSL